MADFSNLVYPFLVYQRPRNPYSYEKIVETSRDITQEWLDLDTVKQQLNLYGDNGQDPYLVQLELATRLAIENYLGIAILPRSFTTYYSSQATYYAPAYFDLPYANQSTITIDNFSYWNATSPSVLTVIPSTNYQLDITANRVQLNALPSDISRSIGNAIQISWTIDTATIAAYPDIRQAGLLLLTHLYNNRSNTTMGKEPMQNIPWGVQMLLQSYKPLVL